MHATVITHNVHNNDVRRDTLQGREYIVAPVNILTAGVHNGSNGPLLYPVDELAKTPEAWNTRPVVVYHPPTGGTATTHTELSRRQVGMLLNTRWDAGRKKLRSEAWLDPARLRAIAPEVLEALNNNHPMEVSTGLYTDNTPTPGVHNGRDYQYVARNYRPDHLAILPVGVGACSIAAGCGMLTANEEPTMETPMPVYDWDTGTFYQPHAAPTPQAAPVNNQHTESPMELPEVDWAAAANRGQTSHASRPLVANCGCGGPIAGQPTNNATGGGQGGETPMDLPEVDWGAAANRGR